MQWGPTIAGLFLTVVCPMLAAVVAMAIAIEFWPWWG
jgi:hypothetical protein